ncbi:hypothetical protein JD844_005298 [Phrynosoma platyrhinos]|uniref:Uncharacterized protein n=1 Tax=Phrynosoma platyrhinos TaxID=52577 RepID=A0ABQ7TP44_PHRPL|nr:hypothetical protein JD844_005298 [Phrynosoma platyrhinos]
MEKTPQSDGEGSSFSTSTNMCEETETSAAIGVIVGADGDHQAWQTESVAQIKKKAKSLCPNQQPNRFEAADVLENFLGEFEVMLRISVPDCIQYTEVEGYSGLFYTLTLLRKSRSFPAALLLEDGRTISPRNVMEEFWKHVDHFANAFYSVMLDNQGAKCLSVSLIPALEMVGPWPCLRKAKEILEEKELLLPLMRVFYFVAKQSPGKHNKETWRISFSHVEKEILNRHGSPQACRRYHRKECCRQVFWAVLFVRFSDAFCWIEESEGVLKGKECLKMLEDLVTTLKAEYPQMLAHLSAYHARTSFLHTLWEWKGDADWKPCEAAPCFERVLENFLHEVATAQLSHFFLPKCNLFGAKFFPPTKLKFLWSHLKEKEGTMKTVTVSRKRGYSSLSVNPDMAWPLMITLGLVSLVSVVLPYVTP